VLFDPPLLSLKISDFSLVSPQKVTILHQACFTKGWSEDTFKRFLKNPCINGFVAQTSSYSGLLGIILGHIVLEEMEIYTLGVHPDYQRKGIATFLTQKLIQKSLSCSVKRIFLEVNEKNLPAINFYIKMGFVSHGRRKNYYVSPSGDYTDAIIFNLKLK
jgi:ribosomal-protein-alanine N-acetyltransferase